MLNCLSATNVTIQIKPTNLFYVYAQSVNIF
jgi:hypothetical protein